jgi:hypothetical protein
MPGGGPGWWALLPTLGTVLLIHSQGSLLQDARRIRDYPARLFRPSSLCSLSNSTGLIVLPEVASAAASLMRSNG